MKSPNSEETQLKAMPKPKSISTKPKRPVGRPSLRTPETTQKIIDLILTDHSFREIAKTPGMPSFPTLMRWQSEDEEFETVVAQARARGQAEAVVSAMIDVERQLSDGTIDPQAARVLIWSKQWRAGKLNQKRYGDKTQIDATVTHSWAQFVEEVAAKRLEAAKTIEGEIVGETENKSDETENRG